MDPRPTILVVDDESGIRELLVEWLGEDGYPVHSAADPAAALTLLDRNPEVALRGVTGVQAASADAATAMVADVRKVTDLPIAVGVGIRTPEQVARIGQAADAVVVGSALVAVIGEHGAKPDLAQQVERAAAALVAALPTRP